MDAATAASFLTTPNHSARALPEPENFRTSIPPARQSQAASSKKPCKFNGFSLANPIPYPLMFPLP
jgi:hypothetical protein